MFPHQNNATRIISYEGPRTSLCLGRMTLQGRGAFVHNPGGNAGVLSTPAFRGGFCIRNEHKTCICMSTCIVLFILFICGTSYIIQMNVTYAFDVWRLTSDVWRLTFDVWRLTFDVWRLTFDVYIYIYIYTIDILTFDVNLTFDIGHLDIWHQIDIWHLLTSIWHLPGRQPACLRAPSPRKLGWGGGHLNAFKFI